MALPPPQTAFRCDLQESYGSVFLGQLHLDVDC